MAVTDVETFDFSKVDRVLEKYNSEKSWLVMILQDTQTAYNWLPQPVLDRIAEKLDLPASRVYNVATFYASFSLKERGRHILRVCDGTACHLRGSTWLLGEIRRQLDIDEGETTKDRLFTLETVACLGACALAPVLMIDTKVYGHVSIEKIKDVIAANRAPGRKPDTGSTDGSAAQKPDSSSRASRATEKARPRKDAKRGRRGPGG